MKTGINRAATGLMAVLVVLSLFLGVDAFAYQLKGTIYGGSNPLPNAKVALVNAATFANLSSATSSSIGGYGFTVANGTYNMSVTPPTGTGFNLSAVNGIAVNGADVTQNVVLMQQAITVSGTVRSSDGTIVRNATINFIYAGTSTTAKQVNTGTTGTYSAALSPGNYDIQIYVSKGSFNHVPTDARYSFSTVPLLADTTKDFTLSVVKVTGKTTDSNGVPVSGVILGIPTTSMTGAYLYSEATVSDASGIYTLYLPPYTNYSVSLTPPSGNTTVAPTIVKAQSFLSDTTKDFALQSAVTVTGTVASSDGTIVKNATISIIYAGTSTTAKSVTTGATGTYSVALSPGNYDIQIYVSKGSFNHLPTDARYSFSTVPLLADTTKDFTLNVVKVTGKTTDSNGVPVSGVSLAIGSYSLSGVYLFSESAASDANGLYTLYLPPYTNYSVSLTPPSDNTSVAPTIVKAQSFMADTTKDFALQTAVTVTGTVASSDGAIVKSATINFNFAGTSTTAKSVNTGATGTYSVALSPGNYDIQIYVSKGSFNHVPTDARYSFSAVPLLANTSKDFTLSVVKVTGKTTDSNGVPVSGVSLAIGSYSLSGVYLYSESATSDANGLYTLYLPPYTYSINITPPTGSGFASQLLKGLSITETLLQNIILDLPDIKPPVIISGPSVSSITNTMAVVEWQTSEPTTASLKYGTTNPPSAGVTIATAKISHSQTLTGLVANTTYYVSVAATDTSGNGPVNSAVVSFRTNQIIDIIPPVILEGPMVTSVTHNSASVQWSTNEPSTGTLYYGLTSNPATTKSDPAQTTSHNIPLTGLAADTIYYVKVAAKDLKNNGPTTSAVASFRTLAAGDSTPPLIVEGPMAINISDSEATILWKTDEPATSGVSYNDGVAYGLTTDPGLLTDHSIRLTGLKPSTTHSYTVSSKDALGNGPTLSQADTFKTLATPDTEPPVIIERSVVVYTTHQSAVIFWRTDEPADSLVEFGKTNALGSSEGKAALVTQHTITLTGLEQGTLYYFRVSSKDALGNGPTVSTILTFTTDTLLKAKSLVITKGPDLVFLSTDLATISWETDIPADSVIEYATAGVPGTQRVSDAKREKKHQLSIGHLVQNTSYTATVNSSSVDGASAKATTSFTTLNPPDTEVLQIVDGPTAIGITDSKASIKWRTDRTGDSRVFFGIQGQAIGNFEGETKYLKEHVVVLTNLKPATTYTYYVQSYDPKGNAPATSSVWTFTTKGAADLTGPTISTPTVSSITDSQAVIDWTTGEPATTQVAFGLTADLLNSQAATPGLSEAHDITLTNLAGETTYYVRAISADTSGNPSESSLVSFTTIAAPRYWKATPAATSYGSISPSTAQTLLEGGTTSFTLTPATGYLIGSVSGCGGTLSGDTFSTGPVNADCTVTALFISDHPKVSLATSASSPQPVGSSVTLTATGSGGKGTGYQYAFQVAEGGVWKTVQEYSDISTWTWDTSGKAAAIYTLKVLIRNVGSTATSEGYASLVYELSPLPKPAVTLSTSPASPQPPGTQVTFTATGSGGTGTYEYAFQILEAGVWTTFQAYGSATTWTWDTTGSPLAAYSIRALIRNAGSTASYDNTASLSYSVSAPPKPTVLLAAGPTSPQVTGTPVTFTATASGGAGTYQYAFQILEGSVYQTVQDYSGTNTWVWHTTGKTATSYTVKALVRSAGSTATSEGYASLTFILSALPKPTMQLSTNLASPQVPGTQVVFTANGSGGTETYEYAFQIFEAGAWKTTQAYGSENTWTWDTTGGPLAAYSLRALIRNAGTTAAYDNIASLSYTLSAPPKPTVLLAAGPTSPQVTGTPVTFTATGSGGTGSYEYAFQILEASVWQTVQDYSGTNTWAWNTAGKAATTYQVKVLIRNAGASEEGYATLSYSLSAPPKPTVQLSTNLASPQMTGTQVVFTAAGSGGTGNYEYAFRIFDGAWKTIQAFGSADSWTWDTTGKTATTYPVTVLIRNAGSTAASEGTASLNFVLTAPPPPSVNLTVTPASPQLPGVQAVWTAIGSGGSGSYQYAFQIFEGGVWKTMQDYSSSNTWVWDTTGKIYTTYSVKALIRNAGSTAISQATTTVSYVLSSPPKPTVTLTVGPVSPQLPGTQVTLTATGKGGTGSYEYSFEVAEGGVWKSYQGYSSANTWTWDTTGKAATTYSIRVAIRNAGSPVAAEGTASLGYVISAPPKPTVTLAAGPASPQLPGTQVTLTATGKGGTGNYEYSFEALEGGVWKSYQGYSSVNTWTWDSTGKAPAAYSIRVAIRNAGSTAAAEGTASMSYTISAPPKPTVKLVASLVSPQPLGTQLTLTATGSGGTGSLEYSFKMFIAGVWTVVQPYGSTNTWTWDSAGKTATTYSFMALVRNVGSTTASEGTAALNFLITP